MAGRRREGQQPLVPPQPPPKALELLSLLAHKPQLSNPACLQHSAERVATKHVCRASPNLAGGLEQGGGQRQREPACLARGASHCSHCSDQGRGSCHSQAVLLGRKGQDGDLGAAPLLSTLWQRRGTAGAPGLILGFWAAGCFQGLGFLPLERSCLVRKPAPNDPPACLAAGQKCPAYLLDEQ